MNWLTLPATDGTDSLAMELLSELLLGHDGAPLAKALRDSGLGEDLSPQCGVDSGFRQILFSAGLRGTRRGKEEDVEGLIVASIERAAADGFSPEALDAAMHGIAFANREIRRGSGAFGLRLFNRAARGWLHGASPEATLSFEAPLAELKSRMASDQPLPRVHGSEADRAEPASDHGDRLPRGRPPRARGSRSEARLSRSASGPSPPRPRPPSAHAARPGRRHGEPRPARSYSFPASPKEGRPAAKGGDHPPRRRRGAPESRRSSIPLFTNGIVYLDMAFPLDALPRSRLPLLPLASRFVAGAGLVGESYALVAGRLARSAGGFSVVLDSGTPATTQAGGPGAARSYAVFRLKALAERFPQALELATSLLVGADYADLKRLSDVFAELRNDVVSAIVPAGNAFAQTRAASRFGEASAIEDLWEGHEPGRVPAREEGVRCRKHLGCVARHSRVPLRGRG